MSTNLRKYGKRIIILSVAIALIVLVFVTSDRLLKITQIQVEGAPVKIEIDEKKMPRSLLFFPVDKIRNELLSNNPVLSDVRISKKYPHTLVISLSIRQPLARLEIAGKQFLIDENGTVIGESISSYPILPVISVARDDSLYGAAIHFINVTRGTLEVTRVEKFDSLSLLAQVGNTNIVFTQSSAREISATLQTIFAGFRIKGTLPTRIDLRFGKPIVTF